MPVCTKSGTEEPEGEAGVFVCFPGDGTGEEESVGNPVVEGAGEKVTVGVPVVAGEEEVVGVSVAAGEEEYLDLSENEQKRKAYDKMMEAIKEILDEMRKSEE